MRFAFSWIEAMVVLAIIAILAGLVVALIMHEHGIHAGYVVGRSHHDAYTTIIMAGKVAVPQHHPERWSLDLAFDGKTNDWDVDQATYDAAKNGMWYNHDSEILSDKPIPEEAP